MGECEECILIHDEVRIPEVDDDQLLKVEEYIYAFVAQRIERCPPEAKVDGFESLRMHHFKYPSK